MLRVVLFDLDGTLLDTLDDLKDALNFALHSLGFPERNHDDVRRFVGNGVRQLIERALPKNRLESVEDCMTLFKQRYAEHMQEQTRAYPGVLALLDALRVRGIKIAVISNKYDAVVAPLCIQYFGARIDLTMGERDGIPRKPAPDSCFEMLRALGVSRDEAIYIGDSETDVQTAKNAGLRCAGVAWGFRDRTELIQAGADWVLDDIDGLSKLLLD